MSSVSGSAADIPQKVKRYNELTDMDVYTWVTLADCELPVRKGSLTPINEGYARSTNANRETKYPMLVRDKNGDSFYMLTNTTCKYRRDGSMLPTVRGNISGVLVHETHDRFVWMGSKDMGDIGRYQIRHLTREDIALEKGFRGQLLGPPDRIPLRQARKPHLPPPTGDNGYLTFTHPDEKSGDAGWGVSDPSYLGPIGNESNPDKKKPWGGTNKGNVNGNGVVENGKQMCSDPGTNNDGKGKPDERGNSRPGPASASGGTPKPTAAKRGCSTSRRRGISTDVLSMQVAMQNRSIGGPATSGSTGRSTATTTATTGTRSPNSRSPDIVNWNYTLYWQCAGYKYINVPLPLELLARRRMHPLLGREQESRRQGRRRVRRPDHHHRRDRLLLHRRTLQQITLSGSTRLQRFCRRGSYRSTRIQTVKHLLFLIFAVQACLPGFAACDGRVRIVPRPAEVEELPGSFRLTPRTPVVITDERLRTPAEIFRPRRRQAHRNRTRRHRRTRKKHAVTLQLQPGYEAEEVPSGSRQTAHNGHGIDAPGGAARASKPPAAGRRRRFPPASSATSPRSPRGRCSTSAAISSRSRT